jgi:FkbM family methyltransferase
MLKPPLFFYGNISGIIKNFLGIFNLQLINLKIREKYNTINTIKFLINKIKLKKITIFDVGANLGQFSHDLRNISESLNKVSIIHCFEPNKNLTQVLKSKLGSKNIFINSYGLSNKIKKSYFYLHENHVNSSFLKINKKYFQEEKKKYQIKKISVKTNTLDNYLKKNKIRSVDFLKIDTQAFNEEVIEGSKQSLKNGKIKIIYSEITLGKPYSKSENFINFEKYLIKCNYILFGIDIGNNLVQVPSLLYNIRLNLDVFYVHKKLLKIKE